MVIWESVIQHISSLIAYRKNCPLATFQLNKDPLKIKKSRLNNTQGSWHCSWMIFWFHLWSNKTVLFFENKWIICGRWKETRKTQNPLLTTRPNIRKSPYCKNVHHCCHHNQSHGHRHRSEECNFHHHIETHCVHTRWLEDKIKKGKRRKFKFSVAV